MKKPGFTICHKTDSGFERVNNSPLYADRSSALGWINAEKKNYPGRQLVICTTATLADGECEALWEVVDDLQGD